MRVVFEGQDVVVYAADGGRRTQWHVGSIPANYHEDLERAMHRIYQLGKDDAKREIRSALEIPPSSY